MLLLLHSWIVVPHPPHSACRRILLPLGPMTRQANYRVQTQEDIMFYSDTILHLPLSPDHSSPPACVGCWRRNASISRKRSVTFQCSSSVANNLNWFWLFCGSSRIEGAFLLIERPSGGFQAHQEHLLLFLLHTGRILLI